MLDKENLIEKSSFLFEEFIKNNSKFKTLSHFRRSPGSYLLMLKIMEAHFSEKELNVEELIREIPTSIASRLSLFSVIDNAQKKNFLKKINSLNDKRKKKVVPADFFVKEFKDWLNQVFEAKRN